MNQFSKVLLAAWLGSLFTACLIVAPLAFQILERVAAGRVAGVVFFWEGWIGLLLFGVFVILNKSACARGKARSILLIVSTTFPWIGAVALGPLMERARGAANSTMF